MTKSCGTAADGGSGGSLPVVGALVLNHLGIGARYYG